MSNGRLGQSRSNGRVRHQCLVDSVFLVGVGRLGMSLLSVVACLFLQVLGFFLDLVPRSLALSATLCSISLILSPALSTALPTSGATSFALSPSLVAPSWIFSPAFSMPAPVAFATPLELGSLAGVLDLLAQLAAGGLDRGAALFKTCGGLFGSRSRPDRYCSPRGPKPAKRPEEGSFSDEVAWKTSP